VPVWQLGGPVPPEVRAASRSALDHVARALHSVVERLDAHDRFALIACAEEAVLLARSASGAQRAELARGISRLSSLNLGEQTDLAHGIDLALNELRHGRDKQRVERLLLLTDGFTQRPDACLALANVAAAEGVAISTIGLGGEFQEEVLTDLADRSGGRALFLHKPDDIPRTIAAELAAARAAAARAVSLRVVPAAAVVRRVTRIRPDLTTLYEGLAGETPPDLPLGDIAGGAQIVLLLELPAPPSAQSTKGVPLAQLALVSAGTSVAQTELHADYNDVAPPYRPEVLDAAARAAAARLQRRAVAAATGNPAEAARLLRAAAARLDDLGEHALAGAARTQALALEQGGAASPLATKELTYATRRLGGE